MPALVVITGPIGAGKSAVAKELANRYRAAGLSAAVVDLDDTVGALHAPVERFEQSWEQARDVHGALTAAWIRSSVDAVVVDGPFYTATETAALMRHVPEHIRARRVMLLASLDAALDRVRNDPARGLSKDPSFLRATHDRFAKLLPDIAPCEWVFDTTTTPLAEIVATLEEALVEPQPGG